MVRPLTLILVVLLGCACQGAASPPGQTGPAAPATGTAPTADVSDAPSPVATGGPSLATDERVEGTFMSARYGYGWTLPAGWRVTEVPGSGGVHPGEPGLDTFTDGRGTTVTVGVVVVAPTQQLASWICPVVAHLEGFHGEPREAVASLTVGGVPATISTFHFVAPPYRVLELEVQAIRGTQGFFLSWTDTLVPTVPDADQMARFRQLLAGFSFAT
ncbi:MAG TPA: hypothetical protein VMH24_03755 [Candidatus Sulfotelmatobacter sp.]|nr:hypothetical protein [Candidatus Sulfotelmatobacter sp.]